MKPATRKRNTKSRSLRTLFQGSAGAIVAAAIMAAQPFVESGEWKLAAGAALTAALTYVTSVAQNALGNRKRQGLPIEED